MSGHGPQDWAGEQGDRWLNNIDRFEGMIAAIGEDLIQTADFKQGERVVDIGCGGGPTSLRIAEIVGTTGTVTGVDIAPQLVRLAQNRAVTTGLKNVHFAAADMQTAALDGPAYDRLFSRFGVMFFDDSDAAFSNMRTWLKPSGRIDFACWAAPDLNPWMGKAMAIIGRYIDLPTRDPMDPGPFRFADPDATRALLERAGFTDVHINQRRADQPFGGPHTRPEEATDFVLSSMAMAEPLAAAGEDILAEAKSALTACFGDYRKDDAIIMPGACWFVRARSKHSKDMVE